MIILSEKLSVTEASNVHTNASLRLDIDTRSRSRARVTLDDGREAGIFLARGGLLRGGDILKSDAGLLVKIVSADERVSSVYFENALTLMKAAYHLGNRHVPLQIESRYLRYQHDHTLDDMLCQMGLKVEVIDAPFEPEAGAYQQMNHTHGLNHDDQGQAILASSFK